MSDQQVKSEMFMQFIKKDDWQGGGPVWAECAAEKRKDDDWMKDFNPENLDTYSDFFEVTKFEFGAAVKPEDTSKTGPQTQRPGFGSTIHNLHGQTGGKSGAQGAKSSDAWQSWRSATTDADIDNLKYPFEVDKFQFDRLIDAASIVLFEACCGSQTFKSAVFVKRVWTGGVNAKPGKAFLRIDFEDVMVTSLNWDDGDMLNESCEFICRGFKMQYRRQNPDGSLLEPVSAEWHYKKNALGRKTGT